MSDKIDNLMFAPCGINCAVCYKHIGSFKQIKICSGCNGFNKPKHCHTCKIKKCAIERKYSYCFECENFPCKLIKNLENSYKKYGVSIIDNGNSARNKSITSFLAQERQKYLCIKCGGVVSSHDNLCSECGNNDK